MSQSGKLIVLNLVGELAHQGFQVTAEITTGRDFRHGEIKGELPPCPELAEALGQWQRLYRNLGSAFRIRPKGIEYIGTFNHRQDCFDWAAKVQATFLNWLTAASFRPVDQRLRETWQEGESIQIMVRSKDAQVHHLPWHVWDLVDHLYKTEASFGPLEFRWQAPSAQDDHPGKVKILAILGHSEGIDTAADRQILQQLPHAEVTFLAEPRREQISDRLWEQSWDIFVFCWS